jgi:hypothetical protein
LLATKEGVRFFDPILDALQRASETLSIDLTITSGTDGAHSGPTDPHHLGRAYDVRSHDLSNKDAVLLSVMQALNDGPVSTTQELKRSIWVVQPDGSPREQGEGLITARFFGWLEAEGTPNEHFHFQWRHGVAETSPIPTT